MDGVVDGDTDEAAADHQGEDVDLAEQDEHCAEPPHQPYADGQQGEQQCPGGAKHAPDEQDDPDHGAQPYGGDVLLGQLAGVLAVEEGAAAQQLGAGIGLGEALLGPGQFAQQRLVALDVEGGEIQLGAHHVPVAPRLVPAHQPALLELHGATGLGQHPGPGQQQRVALPLGAGDTAEGGVDLAEHPLAPPLGPPGKPGPARRIQPLPGQLVQIALPGGGQLGLIPLDAGQGRQLAELLRPEGGGGAPVLAGGQAQQPDQLAVELLQQTLLQGRVQIAAGLVGQQIHQAGVDAAVGQLPGKHSRQQQTEPDPEGPEPAPGGFSVQQGGLSSSRRGRRAGAAGY